METPVVFQELCKQYASTASALGAAGPGIGHAALTFEAHVMANPENLSQPRKQVSVERGGLGQSGYTAGRREGDVSLDDAIDTRYVAPPGSGSDGLGLDDRFTGRGGPVSDVERDGPGEAVAQPYPSANGAPDPVSSEPDGA